MHPSVSLVKWGREMVATWWNCLTCIWSEGGGYGVVVGQLNTTLTRFWREGGNGGDVVVMCQLNTSSNLHLKQGRRWGWWTKPQPVNVRQYQFLFSILKHLPFPLWLMSERGGEDLKRPLRLAFEAREGLWGSSGVGERDECCDVWPAFKGMRTCQLRYGNFKLVVANLI